MKSLITVVFMAASLALAAQQQPKKIALIVAISDYKEETGWNKLNSDKDIPIIREALKQQGFKNEDIAVLKDKPTKKAILSAIRKNLIDKAAPGDIAVFHFSGHGQQITDDNGDEADGYDEALVPYDAMQIAPLDYDISTERHLRDDEFGLQLDTLRKKLGTNGNLLVLVDACHSGTSTRGLSNFRGTPAKFELKKNTAKKAAPGKKIKEALFDLGMVKPGYSTMACFFASSADECNQEATLDGVGCGSLSLAFSRAVSASSKTTSYRALFDAIKLQMNTLVPNQTPQAEGDLDSEIFGGKALGKPDYFTVITILEDKKVSVNCGKLMGIHSGTSIKLFPPDTRDTTGVKPLARGVFSAASQYNSQADLDTKLTDEQLKTAWVYLDNVNYGELTVRVRVNVADKKLAKEISDALAVNKQVKQVTEQADINIVQGAAGFSSDSLTILNSGEMVVNRTLWQTENFSAAKTLDTSISNFARANYLRNLPLANEQLLVEFEFVPVEYTPATGNSDAIIRDLKAETRTDGSGNWIFQAGDRFRVNIINKSGKRVYYTMLDIQPDNQVGVLFPARSQTAADCFIKPDVDTLKLMNVFRIGPPYGTDVIKVITSLEAIDLRPVFKTRGAATRGEQDNNPFKKLLQGTFNTEGTKTRGTDEETIPPSEVNIFSKEYKIVPKK